jgi:class 3 adenylate cyclase/tetratricopeptide (TPR) repeat protein
MKCPKCGSENREGVKFCEECGAKLELACPACSAKIPLNKKFCGECGSKLRLPTESVPKELSFDEKIEKIQRYLPQGLTEKILSQRNKIEGERKQVTVMFCDLKGFTALSEKLGIEEAYGIMDRVYEICIHKVHAYEGTVNEMTGDGIMALFGAPIALEDAPQRAIRSAQAIHREMTKASDKMKQETQDLPALKMRIGIHTGPVVVGTLGNDLRVEFKAVGDTVNLASRMEGLAEPGTTCVTGETFKLTEGFFRFEALGEKKIKGKEKPVKAYRVLASSTRRTRFEVAAERGLTPFVGRERELNLLLDGFERSREGKGQALSIISEAGMGKTRLLYEFRKVLANENVTFLEGRCLSYSRSVAYHPVIDILKSNFNIHEEDSVFTIREKIKSGLQLLEVDEFSTLPYFLELFSIKSEGVERVLMSPEASKERIIDAIKRIVLKGSDLRPLILVFEDLHWMDKDSKDILRYISESISGARVLLIFTYRPEFVYILGGRSYHNQVNLNRLSNKESLEMATLLFGAEEVDIALEDFILDKTEGVPFFIEEFVRSLKDAGIMEKKDKRVYLTKDIKQVTIPATIQDVIMARIDSLNEDAKGVLQSASAIEREFSYELLKRVMNIPEKELLVHLSVLKDMEFLYERGIYPQSTFIFKHALTQEMAYDTALKQKRGKIHSRIAQSIEQLFADRLEEQYEVLAHHYGKSGNNAKAVDYLILAAEKSNKHNAVQAAAEFFKKAIELINNSDIELSPEQQLRLYRGQARAGLNIGDIDTAAAGFRRVIDISRHHGMLDYERKGLIGLTSMMFMWPKRAEAEQIMKAAIDWAHAKEDKELESITLSNLGHCQGIYGDLAEAHQTIIRAEQLATETGKSLPLFTARLTRTFTERLLGNPEKSVELTEGMFESLRKFFAMNPLMNLILLRGMSLAEIGRIEDSLALFKEGIEIFEKLGASLRLGSFNNCLGYCFGEIHQHNHAWKYNQRSEGIVRRQMEEYPMGRGLYGEILAQTNVNLMENLFDRDEMDLAWERMESFKKESDSKDFDLLRHRWVSRMNYLEAQILLKRDDLDRAERVIKEGVETAGLGKTKKRQGSFLRLLGEIQIKRNESENAITNLGKAIDILKDVGNPRQLWQAHASLASVFKQLGRPSEEHEQWGMAAEIIFKTANDISNRELRESFLEAKPIRQILSKAMD